MSTLSIVVLTLIFIPLISSLAFMPYLTRETVSFGISISEEIYRSEPVRRMRKNYALISLLLYGLLYLICAFALLRSGHQDRLEESIWLPLFIFLLIALSSGLFLYFHVKMKQLKRTLPATAKAKSILTVDTKYRQNKLAVSNHWFWLHAALIAGSVVYMLANYDRIPGQIALKYDFQGNIVESAAKSYGTVFSLNAAQLMMLLLFLFINWSIQHSKQQTYAGDPERSIRQSSIFRHRWSVFSLLSSFMTIGLFSFLQLNMIEPMHTNVMMSVSLAIPLFVVLFAIILSFLTGQGGSRIKRPAKGSSVQPVDDDHLWKLGVFYYNPSDPSVFVEKRSGIGWTINHAHPAAWTIVGVILIIVIVSILIST
ncbi:DUF1648 domain-containing protein [Paenibacillus apis]|uniref:Membrane protein n=1 Tax=Paenibacillus apis TaxID=1792174 RepID=A0A919Y8H5_9BACL|nr:DUF5808 domain-containing protein [Paenibacillus apis]GIO44280.1 membrane protein [Paenibacillus apis]